MKVWKENEWHTTFQIQEKEKNYNYLQKIVFKGQLGGRDKNKLIMLDVNDFSYEKSFDARDWSYWRNILSLFVC